MTGHPAGAMAMSSDGRLQRPFEILIVDDEPADVNLIRAAIRASRFVCNIAVAKDGVQALARLRRQPPDYADAVLPDLVLLDLNMPRLNGRDVLQAMKADPDLATIPVVILTTSDVDRDILASYRLGASGYVTKPVDVEQLFQAIHGIEEYWLCIVRVPRR